MANQKEIYRLWYEYLKRSVVYKEYCEWSRAKNENPSPLPEKFKEKINGISVSPIEKTFERFLDVHEINFNEWWVFQKMRLERTKANRIHSPVDNYVTGPVSLESDLDFCIDHYKQKTGREPSAQELKDNFVEMLNDRGGEQKMLFLRVNLTSKLKDIKDGFENIMASDEVKKKIAYAKTWWGFQNIGHTGNPPVRELQDYLDVYDMWKEKVHNKKPGAPGGWDQIIKHFEPGRSVSNPSDRRLYQSYREKAEKIISNVERGYFPGDYQ